MQSHRLRVSGRQISVSPHGSCWTADTDGSSRDFMYSGSLGGPGGWGEAAGGRGEGEKGCCVFVCVCGGEAGGLESMVNTT